MSEQLPEGSDREHPIVMGLVALVGVAVVVGLILGLLVLGGTRILGLGGSGSDEGASSDYSMYLPKPSETTTASGPQITLAPETGSSGRPHSDASSPPSPSKSKSPSKDISLAASTTSAGPMQQFDLTGVYAGGEGAILTVQRFQDGSWKDFPATGSVSGETFQIPVQTSQPGANRFRVVDSDTGLKSNEVKVTIG